MRAARSLRHELNRTAVRRVPALILGLAAVVFGLVNQFWPLVLVGAVVMILPAILVLMFLRLRSRRSDTELDATVEIPRPTLRWKAGNDRG